MRQKKCKACKAQFAPFKPLQVCCSPKCAITYAKANRDKKERREYREAKERIKSRSGWLKEAQQAVNAYIRERDKDEPCISCQRHHAGQYHAGHYRTVGANPELRFNELNIWKQCQPCNTHLHGNLINYRIQLSKKIGIEKVEWLEGPHEPKKYTIEDLKEIKETYRRKLKELKNGQ